MDRSPTDRFARVRAELVAEKRALEEKLREIRASAGPIEADLRTVETMLEALRAGGRESLGDDVGGKAGFTSPAPARQEAARRQQSKSSKLSQRSAIKLVLKQAYDAGGLPLASSEIRERLEAEHNIVANRHSVGSQLSKLATAGFLVHRGKNWSWNPEVPIE